MSGRKKARKHVPLSVESLELRLTPSTTNFIQSLYQDTLHRTASTSEVNYWSNQLQSTSASQVVSAIVNSTESNADQVSSDYKTVLDRSADAAGLQYFTNQMDSGTSNTSVLTQILTSAEYRGEHTSNTSFVSGLYQDILQRASDPSGDTYWQNQLAGGMTRTAAIQGFEGSSENLSQMVSADYSSILGRSASAADLDYWLGQLQSGTSPNQVVQEFYLSPEHEGQCGMMGSGTGSTAPTLTLSANGPGSAFGQKLDLFDKAYGPIGQQYEDDIAAGTAPEQAQRNAQQALVEANKGLSSGGGLSAEEVKNLPSEFTPIGFKKYEYGSKEIREYRNDQARIEQKKRDDARQAASDAEDKRHHIAQEDAIHPAEVEILTDPNHIGPDGKVQPIQFLYDKVKKQATTLTGEPFTPTGAQKLTGAGAGGTFEPLNDQALDYAAQRYIDTGQIPSLGYGAAAVAEKKRILTRAAVMSGQKGSDAGGDLANQALIKADQSALTVLVKQRAAIGSYEKTAIKNGDVLVDLAQKVDSSGIPVIDRWIRAGRQQIAGDADVNNFNAQVATYADEVGRILNNPNLTGVLTDAARKQAESFLPAGATAEQIKSLTELMKGDFGRRSASIDETIKNTQDEIRTVAGGKEPAKTDSDGKTDPAKTTNTTTKTTTATPTAEPARVDQAGYDALPPGARYYSKDGTQILTKGGAPAAKPASSGATQATPAAPAAKPGSGQSRDNPIKIADPGEAMKLPPGTFFLAPDGNVYRRPMVSAPQSSAPAA